MNLAPLTNAPFAIQLHAYAALAAFVLGVVQLARTKGTAQSPCAGVHLGCGDVDRGDQLVLDFMARAADLGNVEPHPSALDHGSADASGGDLFCARASRARP